MPNDWVRRSRVTMQIGVSALILFASLIVILSGAYPESHSKWAFGMAGLVAGYWLR